MGSEEKSASGIVTEAPPPYSSGYGAIPQQEGYPPQQPGYPSQPYPQGQPPQGAYPQQQGYPQQQPGYPPQQGAPYSQVPAYSEKGGPPPVVAGGHPGTTTTTIITQPVVAAPVIYRYGPMPVNIICPRCNANVVTACSYSDGAATWLLAGGICLLGGWFGCCLIPFCMQSIKDVTHACPNCKNILGKYNRM